MSRLKWLINVLEATVESAIVGILRSGCWLFLGFLPVFLFLVMTVDNAGLVLFVAALAALEWAMSPPAVPTFIGSTMLVLPLTALAFRNSTDADVRTYGIIICLVAPFLLLVASDVLYNNKSFWGWELHLLNVRIDLAPMLFLSLIGTCMSPFMILTLRQILLSSTRRGGTRDVTS